MPGRNLSQEEQRLLKLWDQPPRDPARRYLDRIAISGGLRGIHGLLVPFRYPISAVCGRNGVGKTTILALAALAYHSPKGWQIPNWLYQPRARVRGQSHYTFSDFFIRSSVDKPLDGATIEWTYRSAGPEEKVEFVKGRRRWGRYANRPEQTVAFLPTARMLPAHEVAAIRSTFADRPLSSPVEQLSSDTLTELGYVMGTEYNLAKIHSAGRHAFQQAKTGATFTGFNMGGGERWIMMLLHTLFTMPKSSLLVVEEIEMGLHPEAQRRLMQTLTRACLTRQIQIIFSTHSETVVDCLPREARVLIRKFGDDHDVLCNPSTRLAISEMAGETYPELMIYCEDGVSRILIEESLPYEYRRRCLVLAVGSNATVIRQAVSHLKSQHPMKVVCILDGDCAESNVRRWIRSATADCDDYQPEYLILPGQSSPELWAASQLLEQAYRSLFAEQFDCSVQEADTLIQAVRTDIDHHDLGHEISRRTGMDRTDCVRRTMRSVAARHPQLDELRQVVVRMLG